MRRTLLMLVVAAAVTPVIPIAQDASRPPAGFSRASADALARFERIALDTPTPDHARRWLQALTEEPHVAGTPAEKRVADWVRDRFAEFGLAVETVKYDVFLNHPQSVTLKMTKPVERELSLIEDAYAEDKDSTPRGMFPAFHGYGASGRASGQVIYVNYGSPADHARLKDMGLSVEGKIVLVRYGGAFRGLKVKEAQERGALGVLIYSDPADDGYMRGEVYPDGPMRPPSAIQRGSVQYLSLQPGDPSTPGGIPSIDGARRITRDQMANVPKIPSLPISYREAEHILRALGGPRVPDAWQGGLPFTYHAGPGGAEIDMSVLMDEGLKPIYNVIARIPGSSDEVVVFGNHRDAWTPGAVDPNSGTAAMLETARALAAAVKAGWQPKRTILFCSWDGEEYGLVGSTEWAEANAAMLGKAIAYVNVDTAVTGPNFGASGVPSLRDLVREVAALVPEPRAGGTVGAVWERRQRDAWAAAAPVVLDGADPTFDLQLGRLGSGSDYTAFLDHLGVPSVDVGFSGGYGVYHSVYDNFRWMSRYGDPEFIYHQAAARVLGLLTMRLASADVAPLRFASYGRALADDLDDIRSDVVRRARTAGADAFRPDFAPIVKAIAAFSAAGTAADAAVDRVIAAGDAGAIARASATLVGVERAFLNPSGLPGRPWFKHQLIGPGLTTGYAPWPFPGLREAVEKKDRAMFDAEAKKVIAAIDAGAARLREIAGR
ncbi:MAG TPA: M28 family metallopeptidase [Vicinamibacterales bacterium]|nr:M28 family metallopeptidase [Vicinamibacterales bacterium]